MTPEIVHLDLLAMLVVTPLLAAAIAFALPRGGAWVGLGATASVLAMSVALVVRVSSGGESPHALPGAWGAPLGIELRADGLAALMIAMTAGIGAMISLAAADTFGVQSRRGEVFSRQRQRAFFWPLWMLLLAGLNGLYLSADAFNLYITLEIVGLSAVGLTALSGKPESVRAALGYLFAGLLGSLLFLLGVSLLYAGYGRVDLDGLGEIATANAVTSAALVAMLVGLAIKTAIFPLHFWLPEAHSNATAPASALLSALVIKGSLYLAMRFWLTVFGPSDALALLMGLLGAGAIFWGSVRALRADRLKLVVAYSTVAQIGMIVLAFALTGEIGAEVAWQGAVYLMLAHATAKAAMFLAVGRIVDLVGHDSIARMDREAIRPGPAQFAFGLAAISLIGLPPSGGFIGKWLLLEGTIAGDAWHWTAVIALGTLLSAAYLARVVGTFLRFDRLNSPTVRPGWARADLIPLALAGGALLLGLMASMPLKLLAIAHAAPDLGVVP